MVKVSLKYGAILFIAASVCSLLVSSVFVIVDPIIAERRVQKVLDNLGSIYSGLTFEYKDVSNDFKLDGVDSADALYEVTLGDGTKNYVYEMSPMGRNDDIIYLTAYDLMGNVKKIQYVQMRETKGRGDKITLADYLDKIYSQNAAEMDVDMITGATYSSTAMKESLEASSAHLISEVLQ